ncbi:MAG: response regulator [Phycisphaerales bacterium]|nr:response regulator [Phycisphaerales bacterium]
MCGQRHRPLRCRVPRGVCNAMSRFASKDILIVDDDPDILAAFELAFRHEGASVRIAADGVSALGAVREKKPDLLVLDMMLPRSSGLFVLEKLHQDGAAFHIIMVTANQGKRHRDFALGLGARAYLFKPVSLPRLLDLAAGMLSPSL